MSEIVRFKSKHGDVLVEVDEDAFGLERAGLGDDIKEAAADFEKSIDEVLDHAGRVFRSVEKLKPTSAEIEFGVKLTASAGAIFAKAGGEAVFNVKLAWEPGASTAPAAPQPGA
jgi:hypothetical protein